ncbi:BamA/TamA family outer membrane protein [candidate division KSB1 bacterium]|nr:BamA/TamA family outer membrane protein [candidate division KSB1 bacterium]
MLKRLMVFFWWWPVLVFSQQFGQNKIQYQDYHWQKIRSPHFDIYFYQGGQTIAEFVADEAESSYIKLSQDINYALVERISIIVYNSHADFAETNITPEVIPSSVGGFTEFFKNRVIVPFEGSYDKFRHVLHHELAHAVSLQFFFGAGSGAILKGISRLDLSLWFVEGMAEYMSLRWDTESDLFLRDASISGYLPPIPQLSAYMAYKGGQSLYYYIAKTYGDQKISEMLWSVRNRRSVEQGIQQALRINLEELSNQWQTAMRKQYWPDIKDRQVPRDFAIQLTDHTKWQNFVNNSPALSPQGNELAFLSDKSGYFDIYLMSVLDPKSITRLVAGQRKSNLEDLNWLTPGISWSGDGKKIVFAAKSGREDALSIIDVARREVVEQYKFGLDAIFAPAWNPVTNEIAFSGMKNCQTDLYIYNLDTKKIEQLTHDIFSDLDPTWSPAGQTLAFVSDRGSIIDSAQLQAKYHIFDFNYRQTDIYLLDVKSRQIRQITQTDRELEISPEFAPDGQLAYISDKNGIFNIFLYHLETGVSQPMSNLLTGCAQLSWSKKNDRLVFTAFSMGGYDMFLWINPGQSLAHPPTLVNTVFLDDWQNGVRAGDSRPASDNDQADRKDLLYEMKAQQDFKHYVFDADFSRARVDLSEIQAKKVTLNDSTIKDSVGAYVIEKYKPKFTVDYAGASMGYDPFWGLQGLSQIIFSDQLGNHQIGLGINLIQSIQNSDFYLSYAHLPGRLDWYSQGYHFINFFQSNWGIVRFRNYGAGLTLSYPTSRFHRLTSGLNFFNITKDYMDFPFIPQQSLHTLIPALGFTFDNTVWGYYGPAAGSRWNLNLAISPAIGKNSLDFQTISGDFRNYFTLTREFHVAWRATAGISFGRQPQRFVLGGMENWINYKFKGDIPLSNIEDLFFSSYIMPLRGSDYYEQYGSRYFLTNFEFKFPLIDYLIMRFPLPIGLRAIRGAAFLDAGSAWERDYKFQAFNKDVHGTFGTKDLFIGFGYGLRIYLGFALLRIDSAWTTDFRGTSKPRFYFSLGEDF